MAEKTRADCGTKLANPKATRCKPCAGKLRRTPDVICEVCGESFAPGRRTRQRRHCSNKCRMVALNRLPKWNVGHQTRHLTSKGYVRVWDGTRLVMEHRLVMERHLGRQLRPEERVHHLNHDRADNRIENLSLSGSQAEHIREHHPELARNLRKKAA